MVFIKDDGSEFKAPLQKVWALAQSEGVHKHSSQIDPQRSMDAGRVILSFGSKMPDGSLSKNTVRITPLPPLGMTIEYTDGPMTGTTLMQYYTPKGDKTGVTVIGDAKSTMPIPDDQLKSNVLKGLEVAFHEDEENLKKL